MSRGINIAENMNQTASGNRSNNSYMNAHITKKPVVFLSHKSEDKKFVEAIGDYFLNAGINIYLDKYDFNLQTANGNPNVVTECIQNGIEKSDYILCITSLKTIASWWVPYEIGYGKKANKGISTLMKKDVVCLPEYLKIEPIISSIDELNGWIKQITQENKMTLNECYAFNAMQDHIQKSASTHPLVEYLNR